MTTLRSLLERRAAIAAEMRALIDKAPAEGDMPADQSSRFDALKLELAGVETRVERQSTVEDTERRMSGQPLGGTRDNPNPFASLVTEFRVGSAIAGMAGLAGADFGREREVSAEIARRTGRTPRGIFVPLEALVEKRAMQGNILTTGGILIGSTVSQDVIEPLRARTICGKLGATMLTDLVGVVEIPSIAQGVPTQWIGEGQTITVNNGPKLGVVRMAPRTVASLCEFSHRLLMNSSVSIENLLRRDLTAAIAVAVDAAALVGSGIGPEPQGILNMVGPKLRTFNATVNVANLAMDMAAAMGSVLGSNVAEDNLGWALHPRASLYLSMIRDSTGSQIWPNIATQGLEGRKAGTSTSVPLTNAGTKAQGVFGNWSDLVIGMWGVLDLAVNPYGEAFQRGGVEVRAMLDCDVNVRHAESFVKLAAMPVSEAVV